MYEVTRPCSETCGAKSVSLIILLNTPETSHNKASHTSMSTSSSHRLSSRVLRNRRQVMTPVPRSSERKMLQGRLFDLGKAQRLFRDADADGDGSISKLELIALMRDGGLEQEEAAKHAQGFFQMTDSDDSDTVSFDEFASNYVRVCDVLCALHACMSLCQLPPHTTPSRCCLCNTDGNFPRGQGHPDR